jgi:hypothetical protein
VETALVAILAFEVAVRKVEMVRGGRAVSPAGAARAAATAMAAAAMLGAGEATEPMGVGWSKVMMAGMAGEEGEAVAGSVGVTSGAPVRVATATAEVREAATLG